MSLLTLVLFVIVCLILIVTYSALILGAEADRQNERLWANIYDQLTPEEREMVDPQWRQSMDSIHPSEAPDDANR